ncbi:hypothetical protein GCM10027079_12100 [Sediminivirga luteola]|uniref:Uncharacterized protein n=1 Tax=Sediminivirga luteola TaxID=1774748 RepID=A0A8J2U0V0_9MICO|nr:hypothetical protein GCM10011333_30480 [Sediminivirga luteola]
MLTITSVLCAMYFRYIPVSSSTQVNASAKARVPNSARGDMELLRSRGPRTSLTGPDGTAAMIRLTPRAATALSRAAAAGSTRSEPPDRRLPLRPGQRVPGVPRNDEPAAATLGEDDDGRFTSY